MKAKQRIPRKIPIRGVVFQEGDWLSVRCLEYDLATQGRTLAQLYRNLNRLIVGHIAVRLHHNQRPFQALRPAPRKYWDLFKRSKIPLSADTSNVRGVRSNGFVVPPPELRVAPPDAA
jgi:hypothetical protein